MEGEVREEGYGEGIASDKGYITYNTYLVVVGKTKGYLRDSSMDME
jgi:hypothetical protein